MRRLAIGLGILAVLYLGASPAVADFCLGVNCGANDDSFHCHSQNALGNQCWDQFDNACEAVPGFARSEAFACDASTSSALAGGVGSQLSTAVGGLNTFRGQIRQTATSNMEREHDESDHEARSLEQGDGDEGDDGAGSDDDVVQTVFLSDISAALEYETWDFLGAEGTTSGIHFGWQRTKDTGALYGLSASYQQADPDGGADTLDLFNATFDIGHSLGRSKIWKWSISGTVSSFSGLSEQTLYGGGGSIYANKYYDNGSVLSGGLIARYQTADELDDDLQTLGYGLAYGFPLGQRLTLDLEAYGVTILDTELDDDSFFNLGATLGIYFSRRFSLSIGYRVLEGIEGLESETITLGSSNRW